FFFQAEDGIRDFHVTGVQTCALPISIKAETKQHFAEANPETYAEQERAIDEVLYNIVKEEVRRLITEEKIRPDGRALNEIRPLRSEERRVGKECRAGRWDAQ